MDRVLARERWLRLSDEHAARVDRATEGHRRRRQAGMAHPVEDFLFTYYPFRPGALRRWHPGPGVVLDGAASCERAHWHHYTTVGSDVRLDQTAYLVQRGDAVRFVRDLLERVQMRPAQLACFGLHEWAMLYRVPQERIRHDSWPLRLGPDGTDAVVEAGRLRCTHVDAFRFFSGPARPRNALAPTRERQAELEQPGCVHAGMDLYKWAMKLAPGIPSELVMDCFELARELRVLDMRASPYDLRELGYEPIAIETADGRAAYVRAQRRYAERGQSLRARLLAPCDALLGATDLPVGGGRGRPSCHPRRRAGSPPRG